MIVKPETVIAWRRKGFHLFWTWKVRHGQAGRPPVSEATRELIRKMSRENPLWGAPRIHGELLKLGIGVGGTSVGKYMVRHRKPSSQTWRTYPDNHVKQLVSADRATAHPTAEWTARQLRDAVPWDSAPRCPSRDRDRVFGDDFVEQVKAMGIKEVLSAPRPPWRRAYVERVIGTTGRERLDHVIVFNEADLYRHMKSFVPYYHESRTHLWLAKDTPEPWPVLPPGIGRIIAIPQVGGLHHRYERRAA